MNMLSNEQREELRADSESVGTCGENEYEVGIAKMVIALLDEHAEQQDQLDRVRMVLHRCEHDAMHTRWTSQGIALALREALGMKSDEQS